MAEKKDIKVEKGEVTPEQMQEILSGDFVTVKQIATKLVYSPAWINGLCQTGRIKAIKPMGGRWRIPKSEFERLITEGLPPLPKQETKPPVTEIVVDGDKAKKIIEPEKKEEHKPSKEPGLFPFDFR